MSALNLNVVSVLALCLLITSGCASRNPYHTTDWAPGNCNDPESEECTTSYYQEHADYDLAFAEFTDRGNSFSNLWLDNVLKKIRSRSEQQGVVLAVFIHGWKHNADESDENLLDFKRSLASIAKNSSALYGRRLIGMYIGWRGQSIDFPVLNNITFWDRKAVAEEVGKGSVTSLLAQLEKIDRAKRSNVLVVIGHSFGGAIVISAVTEVLAERVINRPDNNVQSRTFGDAVIVLNPAIEANPSLSLIESTIPEEYPHGQSPLFISISSDADWATHYTFPIGQTIGLLLTWHQHDLERSYYYDRLSEKPLVLKEEHLDATAVGNFAPYLTHRLETMSDTDGLTVALKKCSKAPDKCVPMGLTTLAGNPTMGPLDENYPLYFIKTDDTVISGHNDIFNPVIRSVLITIVDDIVARSIMGDVSILAREKATVPQKSILSRPDALQKRFKAYYAEESLSQ